MAQIRRDARPRRDESSVSTLYAVGPFLAGAAVLFLVLYKLLQPSVIPNPGLAAFVPPVGTRPVPLPRDGSTLDLAYPPPPSSAFAEASERKPDLPAPGRQRPRPPKAAPREHGPREAEVAQQWNFGYRGGPRFPF